ncbi:hypothetical protein D3C71_1438430 [compost metagenome]
MGEHLSLDRRRARQQHLHRAQGGHADEFMVQHVGKTHALVLGHRVQRMGHHGQVVGTVAAGFQACKVGRVPANADGGTAVADALYDVRAHALLQAYLDVPVRRILQKSGHVVCQ